MKTPLSISVKTPCSQNFQLFSATEKGGFCNSCDKEVIDFTQMAETELISYFSTASKTTCGRFKSSQLRTYEPNKVPTMNTNFVSKGIAVFGFSLLALCAAPDIHAQTAATATVLAKTDMHLVMGSITATVPQQENYKVTGTVKDEENQPLAGVNVVLKGTTVGTVTDFDGLFEFPQELATGDTLVFSYLGYETKYYEVPQSKEQTINMTIQFDNADVELMGAVMVDGVYTTKRNFFQKVADMFR